MSEPFNPNDPCWLIWSHEHKAWWKPGKWGYAVNRVNAGRYTFQEALEIVNGANANNLNEPNEAMCQDWDSVANTAK